MTDLVTGLTYLGIALGLLVSALVLARQLFGDEGVLSTGWNKQIRAVRVLRGRYKEFNSVYRSIDNYRPPKKWLWAFILSSAVIPQLPFLVLLAIPAIKFPVYLLVFVISSGAGVWVASLSIFERVRKFEHLTSPLTESQSKYLTKLRFVQGRLVLGWLQVPFVVLVSAAQGIQSANSVSVVETYAASLIGVTVLGILFAFATIDSLSAIGGSTYTDFRNKTATLPRVRVSLRESAGGKSSVTGSLLEIGSECVVRTADNFEERLDWRDLGRLAVEAAPDATSPSPPSPAKSEKA